MTFQKQQRRWITLASLISIVVLASVSFAHEPTKVLLHTRGRYHSAGHLLAFALVELLIAMSARSLPMRLASAVLMIGFGCVVEIGQHVIYLQPLETVDILTDALGVVIGLMFAYLLEGFSSTSRLGR